ncbi:MAG: hypothetical protein HYT76_08155 [Deltaproteobacteria bacterium]|nr:hypothetical protein [Deltaproteobacteria bacterium]
MADVTAGDVARAAFASVWTDHLGSHHLDGINHASLALSGGSPELVEKGAVYLSTHLQHQGRHGQYRWIFHLFTDPDKRAADLVAGIRYHLAVHQTYRVNLLTQIHRPIVDGTTLLGELDTALDNLRASWRALFGLCGSAPAIADQQLAAFRKVLNVQDIDDLSERVVARSLGPDEIGKLGENVFARLYRDWLHLATLCRTEEVIAGASAQTPGVLCGQRYFDPVFRAGILRLIGPIALGVAFLMGGFHLLKSNSTELTT